MSLAQIMVLLIVALGLAVLIVMGLRIRAQEIAEQRELERWYSLPDHFDVPDYLPVDWGRDTKPQ